MRSSPDSQRVYRGVLLGLGGIAHNAHLPAFQADPRVASRLKIVGIVDDAVTTPIDGIPLLSGPEQIAELGGGRSTSSMSALRRRLTLRCHSGHCRRAITCCAR